MRQEWGAMFENCGNNGGGGGGVMYEICINVEIPIGREGLGFNYTLNFLLDNMIPYGTESVHFFCL